MSEHDRYVTGNYGEEHPDNCIDSDCGEMACERCICNAEGYSPDLGEHICEECLILAYSEEITEKIDWFREDKDDFEAIFDNVIARKDEGTDDYSEFYFDLPNGDAQAFKIEDLKPNKKEQ